jgi:hypothetical protein
MKNQILKTGILCLLSATIAALPVALSAAQSTNTPAAAKSAKDAAKSDSEGAAKKKSSLPFNGKISAVDKVAKTITVGSRVFQITSETKIFKADRTPAVFDDAVVADHISGSYTKADDGKLNARSVYLGEKPDAKADSATKSDGKKPETKKPETKK